MWQKFTPRAREIIFCAQEEARSLGHGMVGELHILWAVCSRPGTAASLLFESLGLDPEPLRQELDRELAQAAIEPVDEMTLTEGGRKAVAAAWKEACRLGSRSLGTEHLLLGAASEAAKAGSRALSAASFDLDAARGGARRLQSQGAFRRAEPGNPGPFEAWLRSLWPRQ